MEPLFHKCDSGSRSALPGRWVKRAPWLTIDMHCHLFTPAVERLIAGEPKWVAVAASDKAALGSESVAVNGAMFETLLPKLINVDERLSDMDAIGVDIQCVSPSPTQYHSWADAALGERIADLQNRAVAALCEAHPTRFLGLGTVTLQDPHLAARQLHKLMRDFGFKGVQISSLVDGVDIADRRFDPFWSAAEALGAVVFIHPWGTTVGERLAEHYLMNTIGQPLETTICLSKMMFGGTFDRHARLKILAAHGGGYLASYVGRSDHAHRVRPEACRCHRSPSEYLGNIWFDTVVHDPAQLERLVATVGADRIVLGSDYPFDMGDYDPHSLMAALPERIQQQIYSTNAAALLEIDLVDRPGEIVA